MTNAEDPISVMLTSSKNMFSTGLTKREYFAAMAMQGYITAGSQSMPDSETISNYAVIAADALITALNKTP